MDLRDGHAMFSNFRRVPDLLELGDAPAMLEKQHYSNIHSPCLHSMDLFEPAVCFPLLVLGS